MHAGLASFSDIDARVGIRASSCKAAHRKQWLSRNGTWGTCFQRVASLGGDIFLFFSLLFLTVCCIAFLHCHSAIAMAGAISPHEIAVETAHYDDNKSPTVIAGSIILIATATLAVILRLVSRRFRRLQLGADDYMIILALVFAYGMFISILFCKLSSLLLDPRSSLNPLRCCDSIH